MLEKEPEKRKDSLKLKILIQDILIKELSKFKNEKRIDNDLFLSYNWGIQDQVKKLDFNLTRAGYKVWRDEKYLNTDSQPFKSQLADAIAKSKIIICCLTEEYCKSHVCNQEITYADNLEKPLIILMLQDLDKKKIHELKINGHDYNSNIGFIIARLLSKNYFNQPNWPDDNLNDLIETISKILKDLENRFKLDSNHEKILKKNKKRKEKIGDGAQVDVFKTEDLASKILNIFDYVKPTDSNKSVKSIVQYYDNGKIKYEGEFFDNNYNGIGTYYYPNGDVYDGGWKNGKKHGKGVYFNHKDLYIDGFWENDNKIDNNNIKEKNVLVNQDNKINPKNEKLKEKNQPSGNLN
jgi:hypothetical protein